MTKRANPSEPLPLTHDNRVTLRTAVEKYLDDEQAIHETIDQFAVPKVLYSCVAWDPTRWFRTSLS